MFYDHVLIPAVGEPPFQAASTVMFAIKMALRSAREDAGLGGGYFNMRKIIP